MRGWMALLLVAVLFRAASADDVTGPAAPTDPKAQAKEHADTATRLFNVQQYDNAADEYRQAYLLDAVPGYLYAAAQAERLGGHCDKALLSYKAYLRTNPADPSKAEKNIERCEQDLKEHPPGEPVLGQLAPVSVIPAPAAPQGPAEHHEMISRPWTGDWVGHALVGGGVIAAATGLVLYLGGRATIQDNNNATTYLDFANGHDAVGSAHTKETIGVSAMAVGGGLVLAGVMHYILHTQPIEQPSVAAVVQPGRASLVFTRSF